MQSLFISEEIETTEAKAKAIKGLVDKIITQAKSPTAKRLVSQFLVSKKIQDKLFNEILPRLGNRNSGFTSIVKLGKRLGDGALVVKMSLLTESAKKEVSKAPVGTVKSTPTVKLEKTSTKEIKQSLRSDDLKVKATAPKKVTAKKKVKK